MTTFDRKAYTPIGGIAALDDEAALNVRVYLSADNGDKVRVESQGATVDDAIANAIDFASRNVGVAGEDIAWAMDEWEAR